jgi:hypothetical protein
MRSAKKSYAHQRKEIESSSNVATFRLLQRIDLRRREKNSTTNSMRRDCFPFVCASVRINPVFSREEQQQQQLVIKQLRQNSETHRLLCRTKTSAKNSRREREKGQSTKT